MILGLKFDLLSWAIGQSLSRVLSGATATSFRKALNDAVEEWAKALSSDCYVHPQAIFRDPEISTTEGRPALSALHDILAAQKIPPRHRWTAALLEQWEHIARRSDKELQPFFLKKEDEVLPLLEDLSERLHRVCVAQEELFKVSVIAALDDLRSRGNENERQFALPLPTEAGVQALHQQIESTVDCRLDLVAVQGSGATLHIWGNGFGKTARDSRTKLLRAAILGANFAGAVYVGLAKTTDLPGSDGQGNVGYLRVRFSQQELLEISEMDSVPLGYWDKKTAQLPGGDNSPFQNWVEVPWREVEEWQ